MPLPLLLLLPLSLDQPHAALYHAYNQLHSLSQQFSFPIHTPAIVLVGQQTDGKSALLEAIIGFQFNHVGGGTKTRRPIALQMQYNELCETPRCYVLDGSGEGSGEAGERATPPLTLAQLKQYIEAENSRLEEKGEFEASELIVRIDFKYCPNLNVIDTPGILVSQSAGERLCDAVRRLVLAQIAPVERIILCVEETRTWESSHVRSLVASVDPAFERTVVVSTKLDTKFAQLSTASELRSFLAAEPLRRAHPALLGGPFFTSVPVGRVGGTALHGFATDAEYQLALAQLERADLQYLWHALSDGADGGRDAAARACAGVGVSRLRSFLEDLLRERYLAGLDSIHRQLRGACEAIGAEIATADGLLHELAPERVRALCTKYVARFMERFEATWSGLPAPEVLRLAQTAAQEQAEAGALAPDRPLATARDDGGARAAALFGGPAFSRLLGEFEAAVAGLPAVAVSEEQLANALGVDAQNDSLYVGRTAASLALGHSFAQLAAILRALERRLLHVVRRMLSHAAAYADGSMSLRARLGGSRAARPASAAATLYGDDANVFLRRPLEDCSSELLAEAVRTCMTACYRDLRPSSSSSSTNPEVSTLWPTFASTAPVTDDEGLPRDADAGWAPEGWFEASSAVDALVRHIVGTWRRQFAVHVKRKVHFCMLTLIEEMPLYLLHRLHTMGDESSGDSLDVSSARSVLLQHKESLLGEHAKVGELLGQFQQLRAQLEVSLESEGAAARDWEAEQQPQPAAA